MGKLGSLKQKIDLEKRRIRKEVPNRTRKNKPGENSKGEDHWRVLEEVLGRSVLWAGWPVIGREKVRGR